MPRLAHLQESGTLKGAKTRSGGATILVYQAAEAVVAPHHTWFPSFSPGGWRCSMIWWQQSQRSMRVRCRNMIRLTPHARIREQARPTGLAVSQPAVAYQTNAQLVADYLAAQVRGSDALDGRCSDR
jgi:hypothetical protein